jgi:chromosome segregation ATPase
MQSRSAGGDGGMTVNREKKIAEIREALKKIDRGDFSEIAGAHGKAGEWHRFLLDELDREREENQKLREERDDLSFREREAYGAFKYWFGAWQEVKKDNGQLQEQLQSAQQEIERLKQERDKLIEGLRKLAKTNAENISEIREWKAKQNDPEVTDLDWYNYVAREILREIGVTGE